MCTQSQLNEILTKTVEEAKRIFVSAFHGAILYGSFARGDYTSLTKRLKGTTPFDLSTLEAATRYFEFDPDTALVLLAGKGKSPYEIE